MPEMSEASALTVIIVCIVAGAIASVVGVAVMALISRLAAHRNLQVGRRPIWRAPPCAQMVQPCPHRVRPFGLVTAQFTGQPRNQHRIPGIGFVAGQVLALAGAVDQQRLHAHQRQPSLRGQLVQHPPPVPCRLARHRAPSRRSGASFSTGRCWPRRAYMAGPRARPRSRTGWPALGPAGVR